MCKWNFFLTFVGMCGIIGWKNNNNGENMENKYVNMSHNYNIMTHTYKITENHKLQKNKKQSIYNYLSR